MKLFGTRLPLVLLASATLGGCGQPGGLATLQQGAEGGDFRADGVSLRRVLVAFKGHPSEAERASFARRTGVTLEREFPAIGVAAVRLAGSPEAAIARLSRDPLVERAEFDRAVNLFQAKSTDPLRPKQYAMDRINAEAAWDVTMGDPGVTIAVVDTGVELRHPDMKGQFLAGYNLVSDTNEPPLDDLGHGAAVAGIIGAIPNNGEGIAGLAPGCKILPIKTCRFGRGDFSTIIEGIVTAAEHGADVLNVSSGNPEPSEALKRAVELALSKNVVVVAAAGNEGKDKKQYPAAFPGVIAVGSTDEQDQRAATSNYGDWLTVMAPGSKIQTTATTIPVQAGAPYRYTVASGTSFAAPLVSALCGLIRSKHPELAPAEVKRILEASAADLGAPGADPQFGHGRIDAARALAL